MAKQTKAESDQAPIELGDAVRDVVSNFDGIVTAFTYWLNGCVRVTVQPTALTKEGALKEAITFDAAQLAIVKRAVVPAMVGVPLPSGAGFSTVSPGGPRPDPKRQPDAKR